MHVSVYHGEKSISALARRLYEGGRADLTRAQEALLENNPRLDDLSKVAEGTTLLVPEVEGATRTEESAPLETAAASGIAAAVQEALDPVGNQLTASAAAERGRAEEALQVVKAREVKKAAEASRHLGRADCLPYLAQRIAGDALDFLDFPDRARRLVFRQLGCQL